MEEPLFSAWNILVGWEIVPESRRTRQFGSERRAWNRAITIRFTCRWAGCTL